MRMNIEGVIGEITSLPGCSQIAVSHSVFVRPLSRGEGMGKVAHRYRIARLISLGYDAVVCTVDLSNKAQLSILASHGWNKVLEFTSSKTGNLVGMFVRKL